MTPRTLIHDLHSIGARYPELRDWSGIAADLVDDISTDLSEFKVKATAVLVPLADLERYRRESIELSNLRGGQS